MPARENIVSFIRLGLIDIRLLVLAWNLKRSKHTYLSYATLFSLASNYVSLQKRLGTPIQVAEFGVGRGGSAILLAWLVNHYSGYLTLYDVFGRIPPPTDKDGDRAARRYDVIVNQEGEEYYGNLENLLEIVLKDLHRVCRTERIDVVQGKYEETLPASTDRRAFNLVHIDCDWYESSMAVYDYLHSRLKPEAVIQVDDYSNWEGSKRAFQDAGWLSGYRTHLVGGALVIDTSKSTL